MESVSPPAAQGTINLIGRSGYAASADAAATRTALPSVAVIRLMTDPLRSGCGPLHLGTYRPLCVKPFVLGDSRAMRIGLLGGGVMARLFLEHLSRGSVA